MGAASQSRFAQAVRAQRRAEIPSQSRAVPEEDEEARPEEEGLRGHGTFATVTPP